MVLVLGALAAVGIERERARQVATQRTQLTIRANDDILQRLTDAETGQRGYIITGSTEYLTPYRGAKKDAAIALRELKQLSGNDAFVQQRAAKLDELMTNRLRVLDGRIALRSSEGFDSARRALITGGGRELMDSVRAISAEIEQHETRLLDDRLRAQLAESRALFAFLALGTAATALIALILNATLARSAGIQQRVATQLSEQNHELRAQREELEDQRTLLEEQAGELEMTNAQLEEQGAEAERLRELAESANHAKSQFLAMMSHELRTPLNAIGGYADLLELGVGGAVSPTQLDYLKRIKTSNAHLQHIIEDLLSFARVDAGRLELKLTPIEVGEFLAGMEPLIAPQLAAAGIHYRLLYGCGSRDCRTRATVDPDRLRQIVLNLLTNALKFTPRDGRIDLLCGCDRDNVHIAVRDTGSGIPANKLDAIFEPFVQLSSPSESRNGIGLGLALSRTLARSMGGDIEVESVLGAGSTFTIRLPRTDRDVGTEQVYPLAGAIPA